MRSSSPSVRPRARWSGCSATLLREPLRGSAYRRDPDGSDPVHAASLNSCAGTGRCSSRSRRSGARHRVGRDTHRLEHRRNRAVLGSHLRGSPECPLPSPRAVRSCPHDRAGDRDLQRVNPQGGWWVVVGTLAVVASSLAYAIGSVHGQLQVHGTPGPWRPAICSSAPLCWCRSPRLILRASCRALAAVAGLRGLILVPTVLGQLMLFRMLRLHGSRRSSLITYLMPGFALVHGSTILDEQVTAGALAGLALILGGVALASGQRILGPAAQETPA
jgi:hypothetical protein